MADNLSKAQRSITMSRIKSKWTGQERKIHNYLKVNKVKHQMHPNLTGHPDILLKNNQTVVFLNGCFWHKCVSCYKKPKSNTKYWLPKLAKNVARDKKSKSVLRKEGYNVISIWEHQVKNNFNHVLTKLTKK